MTDAIDARFPIPPPDETQTVFENLGIEETFDRKYQLDLNTTSTAFIPLSGVKIEGEELYYINLAHRNLYTLLIFRNTAKGLIPIAHMDYEITSANVCLCCTDTILAITKSMTGLAELAPNRLAQPPEWLMAANEHFVEGGRNQRRDSAIRIDENYQGKGLSRTLIYLTLAQAEMDGFPKMVIGMDGTSGKKTEKAEGLYTYLGANQETVATLPPFKIKKMPDGSCESIKLNGGGTNKRI